jgi:hypothetical protein
LQALHNLRSSDGISRGFHFCLLLKGQLVKNVITTELVCVEVRIVGAHFFLIVADENNRLNLAKLAF